MTSSAGPLGKGVSVCLGVGRQRPVPEGGAATPSPGVPPGSSRTPRISRSAAGLLGQGRKMHLECLGRTQTSRTIWSRRGRRGRKADARPPCAVQTVDGGLPENTHPPAVGKLRHGEQLPGRRVVCRPVKSISSTKGSALDRAGTENDGICPGQLLHPRHSSPAASGPAKAPPGGEGCEIDGRGFAA